jgi:hypothetical protein
MHEKLYFAFGKAFWVDSKRLVYPITLYLESANGALWAYPDGNVIRETKHPFSEDPHFWTIEDRSLHPHSKFSDIPPPFRESPNLRDGLKLQ